jgi:hypothetical protein
MLQYVCVIRRWFADASVFFFLFTNFHFYFFSFFIFFFLFLHVSALYARPYGILWRHQWPNTQPNTTPNCEPCRRQACFLFLSVLPHLLCTKSLWSLPLAFIAIQWTACTEWITFFFTYCHREGAALGSLPPHISEPLSPQGLSLFLFGLTAMVSRIVIIFKRSLWRMELLLTKWAGCRDGYCQRWWQITQCPARSIRYYWEAVMRFG